MPIKINPMDDQNEVKVRSEEEVRSAVITEYGFDEAEDAERIEKLVAKELDHDKKLSSAIGAKIKHRTEAEELKKKIPAEVVTPPVEKKDGLSENDVIYIAKADIHEDDVNEVVSYAKKMGVGVKEAHKFYGPILKERAEIRKTAEATNTGTSKRSPTKPSDDDLLSKASNNELPEDDAEIERLMKAKLFSKRS